VGVAADVCKILDITKYRDAIASLDSDERGSLLVDTLGGPQKMATINEPGLYSLVLRSRKPEAKEFKRWITHEVIPSIRKHGAYLTPAKAKELISDPKVILQLPAEHRVELIPINYQSEKPTVSGRELHAALQISTDYPHWFSRMCEYGFTEGKDHRAFLTDGDGFGKGSTRTDHALTIPMAKELCMLQRSEMGKKFREYFIAVEEAWNCPEKVIERALIMANQRAIKAEKEILTLVSLTKEQSVKIESDRPKVEIAEAFLAGRYDIQLAEMVIKLKELGWKDITRNKLFNLFREIGWVGKIPGSPRFNMPLEKSEGYLTFGYKIKRDDNGDPIVDSETGKKVMVKTTFVTPKGQAFFINLAKRYMRENIKPNLLKDLLAINN
jgi:anti-repressor protein